MTIMFGFCLVTAITGETVSFDTYIIKYKIKLFIIYINNFIIKDEILFKTKKYLLLPKTFAIQNLTTALYLNKPKKEFNLI